MASDKMYDILRLPKPLEGAFHVRNTVKQLCRARYDEVYTSSDFTGSDFLEKLPGSSTLGVGS